jgi:hypothetical protein
VGEYYSAFAHTLDDANDNDCMQYCSQVQHPDFVGVGAYDLGNGKKKCFCNFSGGLPEDVNATDYSPVASYLFVDYGAGPVQSSDGRSSLSCYRYTPVSLFSVKLCLDVHSHFFN